MRVFLKAAAAPAQGPAPRDEPPRTNGNGGSHGNGGELSAFREVLTEFRNLTERYGQALLALGEARGEVAGLRSRVELLEARLDLRLPTAREDSPIAWGTAAASSAPTPEPSVPASVEAVMPAPAPVRRGPRPRPRKSRSKKIAMTGFADALARAQDPSVAGVGDALPEEDVAAEPFEDAVAEQIAEPATEPFEDVVAEPIEDVVAEPVADVTAEPATSEPSTDTGMQEVVAADVRDEAADLAENDPESDMAAPTYSAAVAEPDWFADGDFAWLDAADVEARSQPEATAVPATAEAAVTQVADADAATVAEANPEPEPAIVAEAEAEAEALVEAAAVPEDPEPEIVAEAEAEAEAEAAAAPEDVEPEPVIVAEAEAEVAPAAEAPEPEPVIVAEAEAEVAPAAEVPEPEPVIVAEAEAEADAEVAPALEDPEPVLVAEAEPSTEQETYAEPEPSVDPEPIASIDQERPIVAAWGAPVGAQLTGDPVFPNRDMPAEPQPDVEPELMADEEPNPLTAVDAGFSVEAEPATSHELAEPVDLVEHESAPGPADAGPIAPGRRDPDPVPGFHSPGAEEEVMWIGDDREAASEMEAASPILPVAPARWETAATESWPAADSASKTADSARPPLAMTEEELAQLARDEGWNDAEVAAIRAMIWRPGSPTAGLPGGEELDEAIAALDAVPVEATHDPEPPREWAKSVAAQGAPSPDEDWTFELEPTLEQLPPARTVPRRPMPDPSRARRRKGPAATAYRRLRRLFPS